MISEIDFKIKIIIIAPTLSHNQLWLLSGPAKISLNPSLCTVQRLFGTLGNPSLFILHPDRIQNTVSAGIRSLI